MHITVFKPLVLSPVSRHIKAPWLSSSTSKFKLADTFEISVSDDALELTEYLIVPAGYITDLASIPRLLWNIIPPNFSESQQASVVHDYIYSHLYWYYPKDFADKLLRDFMRQDGANKFISNLFYLAVKHGGAGGWSYKDNTHCNNYEHWGKKHQPHCVSMELVEQ